MTQTYFGMFRRAAIAYSDLLLDIDQRWLRARESILDTKKGYGPSELMRDSLEMWLSGMQAWQQAWMPGGYGAAAGTPVIFIRGPQLVGEAPVDPPTEKGALRWTSLGHMGGGHAIPSDELDASVDASGVLKVRLEPKGKEERAPGLYRGLVYAEKTGRPQVLAEVVVELPVKHY